MENNKHTTTDFTYEVTAEGYTIKFKGQRIGGAGIMGKSKSRGKGRMADLKMYNESAKRDIDGILNGYMPPHYKTAIEAITKATLQQ